MPAEAWQYNSALGVGRIYMMRLRFAGVVPLVGRDTYLAGRGRMIGKLLGRITVVDGQGEELDVGEPTTYLNDAVLIAPSMLLGPATSWTAVDDGSFDVTLTDAGRVVTGRVFVDERGAPRDFSTTDRFADLPGGMVRAVTVPVEYGRSPCARSAGIGLSSASSERSAARAHGPPDTDGGHARTVSGRRRG